MDQQMQAGAHLVDLPRSASRIPKSHSRCHHLAPSMAILPQGRTPIPNMVCNTNNHSGIGIGSSESCSLLCTANASLTKLWEEPESNSATNGQVLSEMAAEVREKRKELGVRDVEFSHNTSSMLPFFFWQLLKSAALEWLPSSVLWALQGGWLAHYICQH